MIDLTGRGRAARTSEPATVNDLIQARIDGRLSRRELIRRATALGISAPVVGVMLHATSDYAFGAPNPARAAARAPLAQTVKAEAPTAPAGTPQEGGTLVYATNQEPDTVNPYITQTVTGFDVVSGVIDAILVYDSKQLLQPALAEGFEISEDGLIYTFRLRQGVKFHNGDPFTPQDIVETWKMIMNDAFGAFQQLGWDKIADITSPDETTVVITTSEVSAPYLSYVADYGFISPVSELAKGPDVFKQEFGRNRLIGTGPFKFVEWKAQQEIILEKNPDYWGNPPKLDKIVYRVVPDDNTLRVQLQTGEVQLDRNVGAQHVDEVLGFENVTVLEYPSQSWTHLDLKHIDFLRETKVRQALDFATPSQLIIDQLLKGRAYPSIGDQAPGTWAHNPNIQPRPYDPEQAKALLDEVGLVPGGDGVRERDGKKLEMELWGIAGDSQAQQICQVIAQSWNAVGVKTETMFQDISTIWGPEGYQFTDKMTACLYAYSNSNDPDDIFYWHSSQIPTSPTGTGGNLPAYFNPYNFQAEIDDLTTRAAATPDQEVRKELYWQIQELLHAEVPVIFIYWSVYFPAAARNLGGFWPSSFNSLFWNAQDWYFTT